VSCERRVGECQPSTRHNPCMNTYQAAGHTCNLELRFQDDHTVLDIDRADLGQRGALGAITWDELGDVTHLHAWAGAPVFILNP
jgi:hypothetical protein